MSIECSVKLSVVSPLNPKSRLTVSMDCDPNNIRNKLLGIVNSATWAFMKENEERFKSDIDINVHLEVGLFEGLVFINILPKSLAVEFVSRMIELKINQQLLAA